MTLKNQFFHVFFREWVIGLFILAIFLLSNGYTLGWDDQHLEIPLLKSLIDPGLYQGDYYVESLKENFTSFLYPVLARCITLTQIPAVFLGLFILSRYILFLFIFKLWRLVSRDKLAAFFATLMIILLGRVEEILYRTFSHQEFALALIFIGIYFFYKERFILASAVLGIAANFHSLYSLFPFIYLCAYLVVFHKKGKAALGKSILAFLLFATPLIAWLIQRHINLPGVHDSHFYDNWTALYKIACPQNFIFYDNSLKEIFTNLPLFWERTQPFWLLIALCALNATFNDVFRRDRKSQAAILAGFGLILFSFIFTYVIPTRRILDLNLIRNIQYLLFILMGHTAILFVDAAREKPLWSAAAVAVAFPLIRFGDYIVVLTALFIFFVLGLATWKPKIRQPKDVGIAVLLTAGGVLTAGGILKIFFAHTYSPAAGLSWLVTAGLILAVSLFYYLTKSSSTRRASRILLIIIPFVVLFVNFLSYHHQRLKLEKEAGGFWQLQRNWIDMQHYVRENTPRQAVLLVPYDMEMGGFRIFSERQIVVSYRDCGIIGFDYAAAEEWQKRIKDIEAFKVMIEGPITSALSNAIIKYRVNYIVFMQYINPGENSFLNPVYENETFALYKVIPNPVIADREP